MGWEQVEGTSSGEDKLDYAKFEAGKTTVIRVLDEAPTSKWRHWLPQANRSVTCCGKECPICASIKMAKDAGLTPSFSSTMKHTIHIFNKTTGKVELLEQGKTFFDQLLVYKTNMGDIRDYDIKVIRTGKDKQTTYTMIPMQPTGLTKEELSMYEANKVDIDDLIKPYTVEQTRGFMEGKSAEEIFKTTDAPDEDLTLVDGDIPY
jgi:hypothetical protein